MVDKSMRSFISDNGILSQADAKNIEKYLPNSSLSLQFYHSGDIIYSPQCDKKCIGILIQGRAVAAPISSGENAVLKIIAEKDIFGIANLYSDTELFPSVITAKCSCRALFIGSKAFKALLENDAQAMRAYLEFLSNKIVYLNKKISTLTAGSAEKKLAFFLCEHEDNGVFSSSASMSAIADILNLGRASLYRAIDTLTEQGLICREGKKIIIIDKNALLNFN